MDAHRGLSSDRVHSHLYKSARWRRLRIQILNQRLFCECDRCKLRKFRPFATVVHHVKPHGGDEQLFFDPANLQALKKECHDRITATSASRSKGWGAGKCL